VSLNNHKLENATITQVFPEHAIDTVQLRAGADEAVTQERVVIRCWNL
jgi:hypothetical protein